MGRPASEKSKQGRQPLPRWKWVNMRPTMPPDDIDDIHFNHLLCFQCLQSHDLFRDTVRLALSSSLGNLCRLSQLLGLTVALNKVIEKRQPRRSTVQRIGESTSPGAGISQKALSGMTARHLCDATCIDSSKCVQHDRVQP